MLANLGSTFKIHLNIKIPTSHVLKPIIEDINEEVVDVKNIGAKDPKLEGSSPSTTY